MRIIYNANFNCLHNIICSIANYWSRDYELITLETWGFKFENDNHVVDEKLQLSWSGQFEWRNYILENYHGIRFMVKNKDEVKLQNGENSKIFAFYTDAYECSWLPLYKNIHRQHVCVIAQYEDGICYCIDDTSGESEIHIFSVDKVLEMATSIIILQKVKEPIVDKYVCINLLRELIERRANMHVESQLKSFGAFLVNTSIEEILPDGPYKSQLLMRLKNISSDRRNMIVGLNYIGRICGEQVLQINDICESLSKKYDLIRVYLIKKFFQKSKIEKWYIDKVIKEIIELEADVELKIRDYAGDNFYD